MHSRHWLAAALAAALPLACAPGAVGRTPSPASSAARMVEVTVATRAGPQRFNVELARTSAEQERGLMYRTGIPADGGMLFTPYPPDGGPPREARFWMHNTPSALDIVFIRPDGTIARIAADAEPYSDEALLSGEPVGAILEINAGRAAALGIAVGDKVSWPAVR